MQLFDLINNLLETSPKTSKDHLRIEKYAVVPLSQESGLIGFVPASDTLHQLITEYRQKSGIPLDIEFKVLYKKCEKGWDDYHKLSSMRKLEMFLYLLKNTPGEELSKVMWLRSRNSEIWLENRKTYTRSLATMSMVGYILGLGDRHPNNIMIQVKSCFVFLFLFV